MRVVCRLSYPLLGVAERAFKFAASGMTVKAIFAVFMRGYGLNVETVLKTWFAVIPLLLLGEVRANWQQIPALSCHSQTRKAA